MFTFAWLRPFHRRSFNSRPTAAKRRRAQAPPRPRLEWLEDRITPTTFTPTVFSDGVSGGGVVHTLRDAILAANNDSGTAADTIQLAAGTYTLAIPNIAGNHDASGTQGDLNITSSSHALIIQGVTDASGKPATVIDQTVVDRVFQIVTPGATVLFQNVLIEGGDAQDDGTAGVVAGSRDARGGGILDDGGDVTLNNVVLQNNYAQAVSGTSAKGAAGGGIYAQDGSLTITNSVLQNNRAFGSSGTSTAPNGGGAEGGGVDFIVNAGPLRQLRIASSTVANNLVEGGDGYLSGNGNGGGAFGGGIDTFSGTSSPVLITASTLTGNQVIGGDGSGNGFAGGAYGGGAFLDGAVTLVNATIAGNEAIAGSGQLASNGPFIALGGGVQFEQGSATLTNVTVVGNKAINPVDTAGGGIQASAATITLTNTLVALNTAVYAPDYNGGVSNSAHNLIGNASGSGGFSAARGDLLGTTANPLNPQLGPLQNNGGPTLTLALLPGSPAINAGDNNAQAVTGPFDQRGAGFPRAAGGVIDIGAFEYQPPPSPPPAPPPSGGGTTTPPAPPSLFQALFSLYLDGAALELASLQFEFVDNLDSFGIVSSVTTDAEAKAAAAGINFDAVLSLAQTLGRLTGRDLVTAEADIHFNLPNAGPFGLFPVVAGAQAALQAVQQ